MKKFLRGLAAVVSLLLMMICCRGGSQRSSDPFAFPESSGIPEFDSLETQTMRAIFESVPGREAPGRDSLYAALSTLAAVYKDNDRIRYRIWVIEDWIQHRNLPADEEKRKLESDLRQVDSSAYPLEYHLLLLRYARSTEDFVRAYEISVRNEEFFRNHDAPFYRAQAYSSMFHGLWLTRNDQAEEVVGKTISILNGIGLHEEAQRHEVNLAWVLPEERRRKLLWRLRSLPAILESPILTSAVMTSSYELTDSIEYIDRLLDSLSHVRPETPYIRQEKLLANSIKGHHLLTHGGNPETAYSMIMPALNDASAMSERRYAVGLYLKAADAYSALGRNDSAVYYYRLFNEARDSLFEQMAAHELAVREANERFMKMELEKEAANDRQKRYYWNIIMTLIAAGCAIGFLMVRKIEIRKRQTVIIEENLRQAQFSLVGKQMLLQEKEQWISGLSDQLDEYVKKGELSSLQADKLRQSLKIYNSGETERNQIDVLYERLDPGFYKRLKEAVPNLTEAQLKFAGYLVIGMTNPQIGRLLNIAPQSVKTKRWRLRQALNLTTEQSLEDELRKFTNQ